MNACLFKNSVSLVLAALSMLAVTSTATAHHGTGVSYDMQTMFLTDAVLVQYVFSNPHPRMVFDRVNEKGEVERWEAEGAGNPSMLIRWGWSRAEIEKALQPGAKLKLGVRRSRSSLTAGIVLEIWNEAGEPILFAGPKGQLPVGQPSR